jgi:hypothetical protein
MPTEKTTGRLKEKMVQALMKQWDAKQWGPMLDMLGLRNEDAIERMTRLLLVHLMLDRAVTAVLSVKFLDRRLLAPFSQIEAAVAPLDMARRIDLAQASHLISASCARDMRTVNTVRNKLAHYQPKRGWGMEHVQELSSAKAYERCIQKGIRALREVVQIVCKNANEIFPTP